MIHRYISHNGLIVPIEQARLSPGQAGLLNGWGLFTTMRVFRGEPFAFERHWKRLHKDAARTRMPFPFDRDEVRSNLRELIRRNRVQEGSARIYAIYNKVGFWQGSEDLPDVDLLLYTAGLPSYREPVRLTLCEQSRHAASPLAGVKVTSWIFNVWTLQGAQQRGFDEALLLNERGEVAECTAANIFCARGGRILTPPLSSGCLEGVTRGILLDIAPGTGIPVEEKTLRPEDIYGADEVFISSTNRSLLGVSEIEGHHFEGAPGPITQRLEQVFMNHMIDYVTRLANPAAAKL
ncbi:MAG TPA: aminotransferase class IV [Candidatus Acidoferrales bacterium]|nr:aminotransferase class IV [Candidatus Acidoferrales bacterium]